MIENKKELKVVVTVATVRRWLIVVDHFIDFIHYLPALSFKEGVGHFGTSYATRAKF